MLRASLLTAFCLVLVTTSLALFASHSTGSTALLRRVTTTGEEILNLNPSLSGDGRILAFETTANLAGLGGGQGFRAISADLSTTTVVFGQIAVSRAVAPAISQDGSRIAFASNEDLVGRNPDRNSEIFLFDGTAVRQLTDTIPEDVSTRVNDGNFQPSISDDGGIIAFSSNRNLIGLNADQNFEVITVDTTTGTLTQLTSSQQIFGATEAKISGSGSQAVFVRDVNGQTNSRDLLLYDRASGRTITLVTNRVGLSMTYGRAISDDGSRVVYSAESAPHQSQVFLFDTRSSATTQLTSLGARADDVPLHPTISGDGKRVAFATRRNVIGGNNDRSVELYVYDTPTGQITKLTDAPVAATAEVISSLNDDGSMAAFNFPRVLSGPVSADDLANNSEIYITSIQPRPAFGTISVVNGAAHGNEPGPDQTIAPDSIAIAKGTALANESQQAVRSGNGSFPLSLAGTTVTMNGRAARILFVSPTQVNFVVPPETEIGAAEAVVQNSEGFQSRARLTITPSAPGLFTVSGDGRGEGVILDADTLQARPFDPTNGQLRLLVFATGARGSSELSATIAGRSLPIESIQRSIDLPGLDELHILFPPDLRGAGTVRLSVATDGRESNEVEVTLSGSFIRDILINELLADPADGLAGDANRDGVRDSSQDEFVELVNTTRRDIDLNGYQLQTRGATAATDILRHRFAAGTVLSAGTAVVVFGGGNPDSSGNNFGGALIYKASTAGLSLLNSGGVITLRDSAGTIITQVNYGGSTGLRGDANESLTRSPDVNGGFVLHQTSPGGSGRLFSPGTRLNGAAFLPLPTILTIVVSPASTSLRTGQEARFTATALDQNSQELDGVIFGWQSNNVTVATVDVSGLANALATGTAQITASARGVQSMPAVLLVSTPSPTPTPSPSPSPSPTPTPSTSPTPTPSVTPSPTPTPSPSPIPPVVISEFRTRGPNGASDEFVELYNNSDIPIALAGWKIRGSSSSGTISTRVTINAGTVIPARGHFLATHSGYSGPTPGDKSYSSGTANDGGIALTLPDDSVVDQVGLSPGSAFKEGMHVTPLPSDVSQSHERKPGGFSGSTQDSGDNFTDFQLLTPSDPQNLSSSPTPGSSPSPTPTPSPAASPSPSPTPSSTPTPSPTPSPSPSPSPSPLPMIVISQIYGGGGNAGAPFRNDFIELFNRGTATISLAGWSVQYATATGTSWSVTTLTSVSIAPGQYYLIQESSGGSSGANLPTPDATGATGMAATNGKVALVNRSSALTGVCPTDATIVDLVGYGSTANCFRGVGPTTAPSNANGILRKSNGCTETSNNAGDFAAGPPNPRNINAEISPCGAMASRIVFANSLPLWCGY